MDRIIDKSVIIVCCTAVLVVMPQSTLFVVGLLLILAVTALQEVHLLPRSFLWGMLYVYLIATIPVSTFAVFIPLIAYDCMRMKHWLLKLSWLLPLFFNLPV
ncbi:MAG TPA: hypothetical protein DEB24_02555, partial [Coriobacteriia bacterium]|nr:hypothetical protein [Coriobacteriia bacterium]